MKQTHKTRDVLILKETPWIATSLTAAFILVFLALSVALLVATLLGEVKPSEQFVARLALSFIFLVGVVMPTTIAAILLEFTQVRFDRIVQVVEIRRRKLHRLHTNASR